MSEHDRLPAAPPPGRPQDAGSEAEILAEAAPPPGDRLPPPPPVVRLGGRTIPMPASRVVRISLGGGLVFGGMLGFLPILGFWMIPLGLLVLSIDIAIVRRWRRRSVVWLERRFPAASARLRRWTAQSPLRGGRKHR